MTIDREWYVPIYEQVAAVLRAEITDGTIQPGRPVPSITTLTQRFDISRVTAARAVHVLADEGLIVSSPGRGWYVKPA